MRSVFAIRTIVLLGMLGAAGTAWGQFGPQQGQQFGQQSGQQSGQSGMFGNRNLGSTLSAGQRSFGSNSSMGGRGGMGQGNAAGMGGAARRPGDFVGANTQNAQKFVGASQAGGTAGAGAMSRGSALTSFAPGQRGMGRNGGMNGAGGFGQQSSVDTSPIRTTLSVAFDRLPGNPQKLSASLAERLAEAPALHWKSPSQVEVQGRTAVLRGVVATPHDRELAGRMVLLEAGIEQVQNEIVVAGADTSTWAKPEKSPEVKPGPASARATPAASSSAPAAASQKPASNSPPAERPAKK